MEHWHLHILVTVWPGAFLDSDIRRPGEGRRLGHLFSSWGTSEQPSQGFCTEMSV